jgi:hypothetical protein
MSFRLFRRVFLLRALFMLAGVSLYLLRLQGALLMSDVFDSYFHDGYAWRI